MTVIEYASFFRILFNAFYLIRDLSEKALQYLSDLDLAHCLVADTPPAIRLPQKIGERTLGDHGEIKQLRDCGIVHYPAHPHLICIMTPEASFRHHDDTIRDVAGATFDEVDRQYRK